MISDIKGVGNAFNEMPKELDETLELLFEKGDQSLIESIHASCNRQNRKNQLKVGKYFVEIGRNWPIFGNAYLNRLKTIQKIWSLTV